MKRTKPILPARGRGGPMGEELRLLLVEDDAVDRMAFERFIKRETLPYDYRVVASISEAREALSTEQFDIVLMDYALGDGTAFDLLDAIDDIPSLIITGTGDEKIAVEAMRRGVYDYLVKEPTGHYLTTLPVVVEQTLGRWRAERELVHVQTHLEEMVATRTAELEATSEELRAEIGRRQQAEERLRQERDRAQKYLDIAGVMFVALDAKGKISLVNRTGSEILGYEQEELVGKDWFRTFLPARAKAQARTVFDRLMAGDVEPVEHYENAVLTKGGEEKLIVWHNAILKDNGNIVGTLSSGVDITERKRAEEALQRSLEETAHSQRLVLALSRAAQAVQRARTPDAVYRAISEQAVKLGFHITVFDVTDERTHLTISHLSFEPGLVRAAEKLTGLSAVGYRFPLAPGGFFHGVITGGEPLFTFMDDTIVAEALPRPFRPLAGRLAGLLGFKQAIYVPLTLGGEVQGVLSITGTDLAESDVPAVTVFANQAAIALENARLYREAQHLAVFNESIIQSMGEGIVVDDADGVLTFVNPAAAKLLGYTADELVGSYWRDIIPPSQFSVVREADERRRRGESERYELDLLSRDGQRIPTLVSGSPRFDREGHFTGTMAVFTDITERKQAEEALQQRALQLALLNDIGRRVTAFLDLDDVLDRAAHLVQERFGFHHVGLFIKSAGGDRLVMRARAGEFAPLFPPDHSIALGQGMVGWVGLHGSTLLANDVSAEPRFINPYPERLPTHSELSVPIGVGDEIVGVLDLQGPQLNAFDPSDVTTIETLAAQIAVAIQNARLFEAERAAREQAEKLLVATQALSATLDLQQVFERILSQLRYVVPYDSASVQQLEENRLKIIGGHGFPNLEQLLGESFDLAADDHPNGEVVRTKEPLILDDAPALYEAFRREPHVQAQSRAWLGVPLLFGDRMIGLLTLDKREAGFYTEEHARLAQAFAAQAAIAIENARLFHETQRRNRELVLLNRVSAATAADETLESALGIICRELALAFEVPQAAAALFNKEKTEATIVAEHRAPGRPSALGESIPVAGNPASQHLLTQKTPLSIEDAQTDPRLAAIHDLMRRRGTVSLLLLPLIVDGDVVGSLGVDAVELRTPPTGSGQGFSAEEVNLAWRVAEQVSGLLSRARLQEQHRQMEEQFLQVQKMEAVGRLAGGIAHDFNNLLTVIHLSTRLLERRLAREDPLWTHVQRIQDAGKRATDLVKQLLAFSRREIVEPQVLNLNQILGDLENMLMRLIGEDVELALLPAGDLWPIKIDPTQIEQVVVNLAVNARDAMPTGGRLTIETSNVVLDEADAGRHVDAEVGEYIMLAVSDTGVGMDDEVKAHLFEPFFTTKERGKGTGLGLATVFGIVKQNRGHIWAYSEPGQGATFKIYLPHVLEADGTPPSLSSEDDAAAARGSETLLLVEDEAQVRELTRDILVSQGYRVLTAKDGVDALEVARHCEGPIHLLLTDVVMPRMGGRTLADQLRSSRPEMKVLYTSGYTDDAIVRHGVLAEGAHFLPKPFELETLARKVRAVLEPEGAGSAL
jgi:PAS domain S-box-containing protein